jgi:multiple sugar transport system permease protein
MSYSPTAEHRRSVPVTAVRRGRATAGRMIGNLILAALAVSVLVPFIWSGLASFQTNADFISTKSLFPSEWTLGNYVKVFTDIPMAQMLVNGVFIAGTAAVGGVFSSAIAAFCLAKVPFRGRGPFLAIVVATMMVPSAVLLIPLDTITNGLGLVDTPWALILPQLTGSAFAVFFLRQHMMTIPHALFEAATIDGCSVPGILFRIYMPLVRGPMSVLVILNFMAVWNDLLGPLIYLNTAANMTPTAGLSFFRGQYVSEYPVLLAGSLVCIVPTTIIFLLFSRQIRQGLLITGLK